MDTSIALEPAGPQYSLGPGIGFNWFDFFGSGGYFGRYRHYPLHEDVHPALDDAAGWDAIFAELERLRPGFLLFQIPPDPHVDAQGRFVAGTPSLERLRRVATWAASHDCTIILDTVVTPEFHEWTPPGPASEPLDRVVFMIARDNRALARNFLAPLLRHVCLDLALDAVRLFTPLCEPMCYGFYQSPPGGPDVIVHYVDLYRELRAALDDAGLPRERLGLIGVDCTPPQAFPALEMLRAGVDIDPYVDAYSVHWFDIRFDYLARRPRISGSAPIAETIDDGCGRLAHYCRARGKPLWNLQMGCIYYGWRVGDMAATASLEAVLTTAESLIRALNVGVAAFSFWSLCNPDNIDGCFSTIGWRDGRVWRNPYPHAVYGTFARLARPGSKVLPLRVATPPGDTPGHIHATALESPAGQHVIFIVNDHPTATVEVTLALPDGWASPPSLSLTVNAAELAVERPQAGTTSHSLPLRDMLPPMTFRAYFDA